MENFCGPWWRVWISIQHAEDIPGSAVIVQIRPRVAAPSRLRSVRVHDRGPERCVGMIPLKSYQRPKFLEVSLRIRQEVRSLRVKNNAHIVAAPSQSHVPTTSFAAFFSLIYVFNRMVWFYLRANFIFYCKYFPFTNIACFLALLFFCFCYSFNWPKHKNQQIYYS